MKFSHLHVHTQFSLLDGAASIQNLYKKAIKDGMPALAISDHGNMFGVFEFVAEAYKHKDENGKVKAEVTTTADGISTTEPIEGTKEKVKAKIKKSYWELLPALLPINLSFWLGCW